MADGDARAELLKLAVRKIVEEALEAEVAEAVGRNYYENGAAPGAGYRNGYRRGRLRTAEEPIEYGVPRVADRAEPFISRVRARLAGRTAELERLAIEMFVRGLSTRDIEAAFRDDTGVSVLSRTAVSQVPSGGIIAAAMRRLLRRVTWLRRWHHGRQIRGFAPRYEPALRKLIRPGDHVLDIGANIGWYTHWLAGVVGPSGWVDSVEPVPSTFEELRYHVGAYRNVELYNYALSDHAGGTVVMEIPTDAAGENYYLARVIAKRSGATGTRRVRVRVETLDSLFGRLEGVAFIKVDVEGHELPLLRGARESLRKWQPSLLVEVNDDREVAAAGATFSLLADLGYEPYLYTAVEGLHRRRLHERGVDYLFLRPEHTRLALS